MMYIVIEKNGTFVGDSFCKTMIEARELACQGSGRRVYALTENRDTEIINRAIKNFEKVIECPTYDYECPYCDECGYCELKNPQEECEAFYGLEEEEDEDE